MVGGPFSAIAGGGKVRSMVGLLPLCASTVFEADMLTRHPRLMELIALFRKRHPEVIAKVAPTTEGFIGYAHRRLLSPLTPGRRETSAGVRAVTDEQSHISGIIKDTHSSKGAST